MPLSLCGWPTWWPILRPALVARHARTRRPRRARRSRCSRTVRAERHRRPPDRHARHPTPSAARCRRARTSVRRSDGRPAGAAERAAARSRSAGSAPAGHRRQDLQRVALADGGVEPVEHPHVLVVEVDVDVAVQRAVGGEQLALGRRVRWRPGRAAPRRRSRRRRSTSFSPPTEARSTGGILIVAMTRGSLPLERTC